MKIKPQAMIKTAGQLVFSFVSSLDFVYFAKPSTGAGKVLRNLTPGQVRGFNRERVVLTIIYFASRQQL